MRLLLRRFSASVDHAISPLDGRYKDKIKEVAHYFSEAAFIRYRIVTEVEWLKHLARRSVIALDRQTSLSQFDSIVLSPSRCHRSDLR